MKLLVVAVTLLSASAIAADQCKPDDTCVSYIPFNAKDKKFKIECKNIANPEIIKNKYDMIELSFNIIEPIDIKDKSLLDGYSFGTLYILNKKYTDLRADTSVSSGISVYVDGREQINAANALISCVNSLNSK